VAFMISLVNHTGNPYIGVYCSASNDYVFVPRAAEESFIETVERTLSAKAIRTSVGGATIIGSLMAVNSSGVVMSNFVTQEDLDLIPDELEIAVMEEKYNATGNNILVNDKAALVHPGVSNETVKTLADVLGVEVVRGTIAKISTVGSVALANSKGIICHPRASEGDIDFLKKIFNVPVTLATLNYGTPWLGACAVINDKGAAVGDKSTPIELGKLEDGLGLF